jgi:hypothetical protein
MLARGRAAVLVGLAVACGSSPAQPPTTGDSAGTPDAAVLAPPCKLAAAGDPVTLVSFPDRHATAPSMLVVDPGSDAQPASVAVAVFASSGWSGLPDDIEIARARVGAAWPGGVALDRKPQLFGQFSLGWGELASSGGALALAWHMDTVSIGEPQFRAIDPATWTPRDAVAIASKGGAVVSLAAGKSVGAGGASWEGDGYAVVWRDLDAPNVGPVRPLVAILDASGAVVAGPAHLGGDEDYPGRAPMVAWTGTSYVVATAFKDCPGLDDICVARSVLFGRLALDGGLHERRVASVGMLDPATLPGTAAMAAYGDRVYVAWTEGVVTDAGDGATPSGPRAIRYAALDANAKPIGDAVTLEPSAHPAGSIALSASDVGVLVTWAESGPPVMPITSPGASQVVVRRIGHDGTVDRALRMAATAVDDYRPPRTAAIASPRGALLLWAGRNDTDGLLDVTWLARLDCAR